MKRLGAVSCGLALSLIAGGGIASASPDLGAIIHSTCTYPQVMSALNAQSPETANELNTNPMAAAWLQRLVASPPAQREQMVARAQTIPMMQQYNGVIFQVANTCNQY